MASFKLKRNYSELENEIALAIADGISNIKNLHVNGKTSNLYIKNNEILISTYPIITTFKDAINRNDIETLYQVYKSILRIYTPIVNDAIIAATKKYSNCNIQIDYIEEEKNNLKLYNEKIIVKVINVTREATTINNIPTEEYMHQLEMRSDLIKLEYYASNKFYKNAISKSPRYMRNSIDKAKKLITRIDESNNYMINKVNNNITKISEVAFKKSNKHEISVNEASIISLCSMKDMLNSMSDAKKMYLLMNAAILKKYSDKNMVYTPGWNSKDWKSTPSEFFDTSVSKVYTSTSDGTKFGRFIINICEIDNAKRNISIVRDLEKICNACIMDKYNVNKADADKPLWYCEAVDMGKGFTKCIILYSSYVQMK